MILAELKRPEVEHVCSICHAHTDDGILVNGEWLCNLGLHYTRTPESELQAMRERKEDEATARRQNFAARRNRGIEGYK